MDFDKAQLARVLWLLARSYASLDQKTELRAAVQLWLDINSKLSDGLVLADGDIG